MKHITFSLTAILVLLFLSFNTTFASGGYDHGTPTGKGKFQLDLTWNPFNMFPGGQTYPVWGYGITDRFDFHGYYSFDANWKHQIYWGFMYCFYKSDRLDLSTAAGIRHIDRRKDLVFPQLLYNYKFKNDFTIGGSSTVIFKDSKKYTGTSFDIALFIPLKFISKRISWVDKLHFAIGVFKSTSNFVYPTYSVDIKF